MTHLEIATNQTDTAIALFEEKVALKAAEYKEAQDQLGDAQSLRTDQENLKTEWLNLRPLLKSLFESSCGAFKDTNGIDLLLQDIQEDIEETKANKHIHINSKGRTKVKSQGFKDYEESISNVIPLLTPVEELPPEEDNETILTAKHIEIIIEPLSEETLKQLKTMFSVSGKVTKISSIAYSISKHNLTHSKLFRLIQNIQGQQLLLAGM